MTGHTDGQRGTRVKICGLRDSATISAMESLPVDEIGFVFADSRRKVTPEAARELIAEVRRLRTPQGAPPLAVGVFVNAGIDRLREVLAVAPLDVVQLHGDESPELCASIRTELGVRVWKVFSVAEPDGGEQDNRERVSASAAAHLPDPSAAQNAARRQGPERLEAYRDAVDAVMIDTSGGGTGRTFHWEAIDDYLATARDIGVPLYVAGGLHPDNVGELLAAYAPDGVDVSSGVETEGLKDIVKIKAFVERVKRA